MNNRTEGINGRLVNSDKGWQVQSGYGTFPLSREMQCKPAQESSGEWVEATVKHGQVISYHYAPHLADAQAMNATTRLLLMQFVTHVQIVATRVMHGQHDDELAALNQTAEELKRALEGDETIL